MLQCMSNYVTRVKEESISKSSKFSQKLIVITRVKLCQHMENSSKIMSTWGEYIGKHVNIWNSHLNLDQIVW